MQCTHVEKLIPLFAGDDLPAREADALRRHLESCEKCRRLAAEFEESRDWLRGFAAPQIDEAMLDGVRDSVLRDIGRIENRARWLQWINPGWNLRFAFAASLALLLASALLGLVINRRQSPHDPKPDRAESWKGGGDQVKLPPGKTLNGQANDDQQAAPRKIDRRKFRREPIKRGPGESPQAEERMVEPDLVTQNTGAVGPIIDPSTAPDPAGADPDANQDTLRIEIQTADPNIRIIWFAPKSDASPRK
jgi:putative zinc finger protein